MRPLSAGGARVEPPSSDGDYDRLWGVHLRAAMRPILAMVSPLAPGVAVDLGAGTGNVFRELRRLGRDTQIVEIDSRAPQGSRFERQLIRGTYLRLPLQSNSADLVTACFSIANTASCLACLPEATRILTAAGMLVIVAWEWDQPSEPRRVWADVCARYGVELPAPPQDRIRLLEPETVAAHMRRGGLGQVDIYRRELSIAESPQSFIERMTTLRPYRQALSRLDERHVSSLKGTAALELRRLSVSDHVEVGGVCALVARR